MLASRLIRIFQRARLAALPSLVLSTSSLLACGGNVASEVDDSGPKTDSGAIDSGGGMDSGAIDSTPPLIDASGTCAVSPPPDPLPPCGYLLTISGDASRCGFDVNDAGPSSAIPPTVCHALCGSTTINYCYYMPETSQLECGGFCEGRRPDGLAPACVDEGGEAVGRWFARSAYLEAASVAAFRIIKQELKAHGAPAKLIAGCGRAARDEIRHTRATTALARRHHARTPKPEVKRRSIRSLEEIAIENAVEGCVRETFGAMLATTQGNEAHDPVVRAVMMRIARDETRHAALSWSLDAWLLRRLSPAARRRVENARKQAVFALREETAKARRGAMTDALGIPRTPRALAMLDEIERSIWS